MSFLNTVTPTAVHLQAVELGLLIWKLASLSDSTMQMEGLLKWESTDKTPQIWFGKRMEKASHENVHWFAVRIFRMQRHQQKKEKNTK